MLNFERYAAGSRVPIEDVKKLVGGTWQNVEEVYANESGQWVIVWRRTPPIPGILNIDSLEFSRMYGAGGWLPWNLNMSANVCTVYDTDYSGAIAARDYLYVRSQKILLTEDAEVSYGIYIDRNLHAPDFTWGYTIGENTSPIRAIKTHVYTGSTEKDSFVAKKSWDKNIDGIRFWLLFSMTEKGSQMVLSHEVGFHMSGIYIYGQSSGIRKQLSL